MGRELWFEERGFPSGSARTRCRRTRRGLCPGVDAARRRIRRTQRGGGRFRASFEGAMATMLVFKWLTALAVTVFAIGAGTGAALAQLGQPAPWQLGLQHAATPVMENIIWFHDY